MFKAHNDGGSDGGGRHRLTWSNHFGEFPPSKSDFFRRREKATKRKREESSKMAEAAKRAEDAIAAMAT